MTLPLFTIPVSAQSPLDGPVFRSEIKKVPSPIFSELHANLVGRYGEPRKAFTRRVQAPPSDWMYLTFSDYSLGKESYILIESLTDEAWQKLDAEGLKVWNGRSAFFNGNALQVTLVVAPGDQGVFFRMLEVRHGRWELEEAKAPFSATPPPPPSGTQSGVDERVPWTDAAVARPVREENGSLKIAVATAWMGASGSFITAGHAAPFAWVMVEFNIPLSDSDGTPNFAHPTDQYPGPATIGGHLAYENSGLGNDWGVFKVGRNTNTGLLPQQAQQAFYRLWDVSSFSVGRTMRVNGYGVNGHPSGPNQFSQTLQTDTGSYLASEFSGTVHLAQVDISGGSSGSPFIDENSQAAVGIQTNGVPGYCVPGLILCDRMRAQSFADADVQQGIADNLGWDGVIVDNTHPSTDTPDGSAFHPYPTIGAAISAMYDGGTIIIMPGTYPESVVASKNIIFRPLFGPVTINDVTVQSRKAFHVRDGTLNIIGSGGVSLQNASKLEVETTAHLNVLSGSFSLTGSPQVVVQNGATLTLNTSITVASGHQLSVLGGGTIKFGSTNSISVYGYLHAETITLTASGSSWRGISFNQGSDGEFNGTKLLQAGGGYGGAALYMYNATPHIQNATIEAVSGGAMHAVQYASYYGPGSVTIWNSTIRSSNQSAVYVSGPGGSLYLYDSYVDQTANYPAVSASGSSGVYFWPGAIWPYVGYNEIRGQKSLYASSSGIISAGYSSSQMSQNHFCTYAPTLEAASGGAVHAKYDYWLFGAAPIINTNGGTGSVYYSNNLGSATCPAGSQAAPLATIADAAATPSSAFPESPLFEAMEKVERARVNEAIPLLKSMVTEQGGEYRNAALQGLRRAYLLSSHPAIIPFVKSLTLEDGPVSAAALETLSDLYLIAARKEDAFETLSQLINGEGAPDAVFPARIKLFHLQIAAGDPEAARETLSALESSVTVSWQEAEVDAARFVLEQQMTSTEAPRHPADVAAASEVPGAFAVEAYPNPVAGMTRALIRYSLPESSHISVIIFDALGREVTRLIDAPQEAGHHEVVFDTAGLASGIYFYRLQGGDQAKTGKLLLLR